MHARVWLAPQVIVRLQEDLKESRQVLFAELRRGALQRRRLRGGRGNQIGIRAAHSRNKKISHVADGFAAEMLQVAPFPLKRVHEAKRAIRRTRSNGADQFLERVFRNHAEQFAYFLVGDGVAAKRARTAPRAS